MNQSGRETERRSPAFNGREGIALSELTGGLILFERIFGSDSILVIITAVVLFAPFAAYLSWRSSNSKKFAIYGAVYSLLMLMPGIWLVLKLRGVSLHRRLIVLGYSFVYVVWLIGTVLWMFFIGLVRTLSNRIFEADTATQGWFIVATSVASGVIWSMSVWRTSNLKEATGDDLLNFARIEPFVSYLVCIISIIAAVAVLTQDRTTEGTIAPFAAMAVLVNGWMLVRIPFFVRNEIRRRSEDAMIRAATLAEANRRHRW